MYKKFLARAFAGFLLAFFAAVATPAMAASTGESFVSANVQKGLDILNNQGLSADQRRAQFQDFLLSVTDLRRTAVFTLGKYSAAASPQDVDAFAVAFRQYAIKVYQSFFDRYSGQTLTVTGSTPNRPGDEVVKTMLKDPKAGSAAAQEVDFRVLSDKGTPAIIDVNVAGIWLSQTQQEQFTSVLAKSGGSFPDLIAHLNTITAQYH